MPPRLLKTSVRELIGFVLRSGDLAASGFSRPDRMVESTSGHQKVLNTRPDDYQPEVPVSSLVEANEIALEISGRIDGLLAEEDGTLLVDEIKTTEADPEEDPPDNPAHWVQAKVYAFIAAEQSNLEFIDVQVTYLQPDTWKCHEDHRTIEGEGRAYAQAPTGIGKTISTLFPAVKAMGLGHTEKIFYLTAKTIGRTVAEKAVDDMRANGARLKRLTLTARDKICFKPNGGTTCDPEQCEFAIGYYDRINHALEDIFQQDALTHPVIEEHAQKHKVCPFEFSLDLSLCSDIITCDYNYVFDPRAYLKRHFLDSKGQYAFLIDEAHNLVDRAREMFSAELYKSEIDGLKRLVGKSQPGLNKKIDALNKYFTKLGKKVEKEGYGESWIIPELSTDLMALVHNFLRETEKVLPQGGALLYWDELIEFYFQALGFERISELFDEHYTTYAEKQGKEVHFKLYCLDPSKNIRSALERGSAAIFFSATLSPLPYFRDLLDGEEGYGLLRLASPFPPEHLRLLLANHIETTYKKRGETYGDVAESIAALASQRQGNYLAFFPSYKYMEEVATLFADAHGDIETLVQKNRMSEREAFLAVFDADNAHTTAGFAAMGGTFGEGIDLVGERLVGAIVVGFGLPHICLERDLIRHYFDQHELSGFEYAYTYPGMNRVLQAAGRVIRTYEDSGAILLVDRRFGQGRYHQLFPPSWNDVRPVHAPTHIAESLEDFWSNNHESA